MTASPPPLLNKEFAELVDCDFTTASRLKNGQRLPSMHMFTSICEAFKLSNAKRREFQDAVDAGAQESGKWIKHHLYRVR